MPNTFYKNNGKENSCSYCSHIKDSPVLKRRLEATKIYASQFVRESNLGLTYKIYDGRL